MSADDGRLPLSDVTIVSVTGVGVDAAQAAMQRSMRGLAFGQALLISSTPPSADDTRIAWHQIPPMTKRDYSAFILKELHRYITTSHVLIVQTDGFVLNPSRWAPSWLEYDYIGAPWREKIQVGPYVLQMKNRVGNGGFSLRSRRLLQLTAPVDLTTIRFPTSAEDLIIGYLLYDYLVEQGVKFAPVEIAPRFSIEDPKASFGQTLDTAFGFHGADYLADVQARDVPA